jgi:hypothetical protein
MPNTPNQNSNKISSRNSLKSPSIFNRKFKHLDLDLVELEESPENFEHSNNFTNWVSFRKEKKNPQEITFFESEMVSKKEPPKAKMASWIFYMVFTTFAFTLCNVSISHITSYGPLGIFYFNSGTILCGIIHLISESLKQRHETLKHNQKELN